jgi:hypothetical protein
MVRGWFRDEDFRGLWHDWAALDAEVKTLRRDLARLTLAHTNTLDALTHVELAEGEVTA